jgi:hypothetical protein
MDDDPNPILDDEAELARYASALADRIDVVIPRWVLRCIERRVGEANRTVDDDLHRRATDAGERAGAEISPKVRALLDQDVDEQRTNPLAIIRSAVRYPTEVLAEAGVPPVERDAVAQRLFPEDVYDLTPGSFADVDPSLSEPGIEWGAAKAHVHLTRRRPPDRP